MPGRSYITLSAPLTEVADWIAGHLEGRGYRIDVEPSELSYPYTPTLRARRGNTLRIIEVASKLQFDRLEQWARFGKSTTTDTGIIVALPATAARKGTDDQRCQRLGIGIAIVSAEEVVVAIPAQDLGVNVELPDLQKAPKRMRELMGPAYDQFDRGQWREGFEAACQVIESEARRYLKEGVANGRVVVLTSKGNPRSLTPEAIDKLTMGALRDTFGAIQNQNRADAVIHGVLDRLNKDRIGVVHHRGRKRTETSLRKNVGQHMWAVDAGLRALLGVK